MTNTPDSVDSVDERHRAFLISSFERSITQVAADLRRLADEVEHKTVVSDRIRQPYLANATSVVHAIHSCLPNLNLPLLIERAVDCETLMPKASEVEQ